METLRVGLVGARRTGSFVQALRALPQLELAAACDVNRDTVDRFVADQHIPQAYYDYEAMLGEAGLDIVILGTPMPYHAPQAVAALGRDIHVLSEVTAAVSVEQCYELLHAALHSRATYMMAENYIYMEPNVLVSSMVDAGVFGEVYYAEGAYIHELHGIHHNPDGSPTWRYYWQVGRNGATYPTHSLGPCRQWIKEPVATVSAVGSGRWTDPEHAMDDMVHLNCKTASGKLIHIKLDMLSHRPHNTTHYALQGTKGAYLSPRREGEPHLVYAQELCEQGEWRDLFDFRETFMPQGWKELVEQARGAGHGGGDYVEVYEFVQAIQEGSRPRVDVYDAVEWTLAGLLSEESLRLCGAPVSMPDFRSYGKMPHLPSMDTCPPPEGWLERPEVIAGLSL